MTANMDISTIADVAARIDVLLDAMTLEEQVALLAGADFWTTVPIVASASPPSK